MTEQKPPYNATPKVDVLEELLESFTLEQLQFLAEHAKEHSYGYVIVGMKKHPDTLIFVPSLKLPNRT